jgi:O-acetyl-ADP-ribose deacetylase (regulator of RNase III)
VLILQESSALTGAPIHWEVQPLVIIEVESGSLFDATVQALVNPVNTEGTMGAGLALEFRQRYPDMCREYAEVCRRRMLDVGTLHWWHTGSTDRRFIINFPVKRLWQEPSKLIWIDAGLQTLCTQVELRDIRSLALPALGCEDGGLAWRNVRQKIFEHLRSLPVDVYLYPPASRV